MFHRLAPFPAHMLLSFRRLLYSWPDPDSLSIYLSLSVFLSFVFHYFDLSLYLCFCLNFQLTDTILTIEPSEAKIAGDLLAVNLKFNFRNISFFPRTSYFVWISQWPGMALTRRLWRVSLPGPAHLFIDDVKRTSMQTGKQANRQTAWCSGNRRAGGRRSLRQTGKKAGERMGNQSPESSACAKTERQDLRERVPQKTKS